MTFREQVADWISGGALTRERANKLGDIDKVCELILHCDSLSDALARIAAMETPGANATVRRMAQEARDALT